VHLKDIHLEKGMQCSRLPLRAGQPRQRQAVRRDAQRRRDRLRRLPRQHRQRATLITSGPAAPEAAPRSRRCARRGASAASSGRAIASIQRSMMDPDSKVGSRADRRHDHARAPHYSEQSRYAKTIQQGRDVGRGRAARRWRTPTAR
jgi:hypothetical protein